MSRFISKIAILIIMAITCGSCESEYWLFRLVLVNKTSHNAKIEWATNMECPDEFSLPINQKEESELKRAPAPRVDWATITFDDGKTLKYTSKDKKRSLCNTDYFEIEELPIESGIITYTFTLTDKDYALAKMPSEE